MRPFEKAEYTSLKTATHIACELAAPLSQITQHTRLDAAWISRAGNPNEPSFLPIDVAADLDQLAGEPVILRALAALEGYDLVPRKRHSVVEDARSLGGSIALASGELVFSVCDAMSDGVFTKNEEMDIARKSTALVSLVSQTGRLVNKATAGAQ